ncbi:MAG: carbohydrate ABC transporter permease [Defluviitaleaceae bacterium]|nr:carbohydrate ABC transporter permease [Defluviitaleaceae bacterium]
MRRRRIKLSADKIALTVFSYVLISFLAIFCVLPFLMILSGSLTQEQAIFRYGFSLIPPVFSLEAYQIVWEAPSSLLRAYWVTVNTTFFGTLSGLILVSMTAYVLFRKDFPWRNSIAFYFFFTTLFSGGLVPWYILMIRYLNLRDNPMVLVLPYLFNVFHIIIMRSFMRGIPDSLVEAAKIDGAGDFRIYWKIMLPLSKPALATIGLFIALNLWNEWFHAMLFINDSRLFPLQFHLHRVLNSMQFAAQAAREANIPMPRMPTESFKLVMTVLTTGPILFLYPFVQRYFIKGITIGAVKG